MFAQTCPSDQEIILHWHDRPETKVRQQAGNSAICDKYFKLNINSIIVGDDIEVANSCNSYISTTASKSDRKIPVVNCDPIQYVTPK